MTDFYASEILWQQKRQADALEGILEFLTNASVHPDSGKVSLMEGLREIKDR